MKILAWADIHGNIEGLKKLRESVKDYDVFLIPGDYSVFEENLEKIISEISKFKNVLIVNGNHENDNLFIDSENIKTLHYDSLDIDNIRFVGIGGGGFDKTFPNIYNASHLFNTEKDVVLVTHAPPFKTKIDKFHQFHVGNETISRVINKNNNIKFSFSGHIHESKGNIDYLNEAFLINCGVPCLIDTDKKETTFLNSIIENNKDDKDFNKNYLNVIDSKNNPSSVVSEKDFDYF